VSASQGPRRLSKAAKLFNMRKAIEVHELQCCLNERFDPLKFIEFQLRDLVKNFEYFYDENDAVFQKAPTTQAYVDLTSNPVLVVRESVVERAIKGFTHERFVLAHEIAHVIRHRFTGKKLAQHKVGSAERNRADSYLEAEANLFAGVVLAPPGSGIEHMDVSKVIETFGISAKAAKFAMVDAAFWNANRGQEK